MSRFSRLIAGVDRRLVGAGRSSVGGWVGGDVEVLLLTTTGRRSGRRHTVPVLVGRESHGGLLVIAANGAADWNPDWYLNLVADPHVEVELDGAPRPALATVLVGDARRAAWPEALSAFPSLAATQREARRAIPLIRLTMTER